MGEAKRLAAESWYGYGRWKAKYWFVGMEPGGTDDVASYESWKRLGGAELIDCRQHHVDTGFLRWHDDGAVRRYNPLYHQLAEVIVAEPSGVLTFRQRIAGMLPNAEGVVLALIADTSKTVSYYRDCESLIWRDAGCVFATPSLCAEWLNLAFCQLGVLGTELRDALGLDNARYLAVGAAVIGKLTDAPGAAMT